MGRKNRNARSRSYSSFTELRDTTLRFDLSKGNFIKRKLDDGIRSGDDVDVNVSITHNGRDKKIFIQFSVRKDIAETMIKGSGKSWSCGVVQEGLAERMYIIPDEMGYALYQNTHGKRHYLRIPFEDDKATFEKYVGFHEMKYDNFNKAYYITIGE